MKYKLKKKQNQRILGITDQTLVIGADVAKKTYVARAIDFREIELNKDLVFENEAEGFANLVTWMDELRQQHAKTDVICGIEPTGHYCFSLAEFLQNQGIKVVVVNPHHVNRSKELEDNSQTKNDYKDAKVIADLVRNGKYKEPRFPKKVYADLRILMNLREKVNVSLGQVQRHIQNWPDQFFPEYLEVFKDWEGKASLITLAEFPTPQEIAGLGAVNILKRWKKDVQRAVGIKRVEKLVESAAISTGLTEGLMAAKMEMKALLEQYDLFSRQLVSIMLKVEELLEQVPGSKEMLTIPGVGTATLAGFLAETGELSGYSGPYVWPALTSKRTVRARKTEGQRLASVCDLDSEPCSSERSCPMVAKNPEFKAMHAFFRNKENSI